MRLAAVLASLILTASLLPACQPSETGLPGAPGRAGLDAVNPHADWMGNNRTYLNDLPLNQAVIPGSHDAGTFSILDDAAISPDLPLGDAVPADADTLRQLHDALVKAGNLQPINHYMAKWARAQGVDIKRQLEGGLRYFDLRPVVKPTGSGDEIHVAHALYGGRIEPMIDDVAAFVAAHPREIVFLDISHFTGFTPEHHRRLSTYIKTRIGSELIPPAPGASPQDPRAHWVTYGNVWQAGNQVVCFYQDDTVQDSDLWRWGIPGGTKWWPQQPTPDGVKAHLTGVLANERPKLAQGSFFVLQTVLTADGPMLGRSVAKEGTLHLLGDAKAAVLAAQSTYDAAEKAVKDNSASIKSDKSEIDSLWRHIKKYPYDPTNAKRLYDIGKLEAAIKILEGVRYGLEKAVDAAKGPLADAQKKVADLEAKAAPLVDTPVSLRELAAQGNPTLLKWLSDDWASQPLNIVILDWAEDTDFVDRIIAINRSKGRHYRPES